MVMPHVVSVQHTGTRFAMRLLQCPGDHIQHFHKGQATGKLLVTPMRHPRRILESWVNRNNMRLPDMLTHFQELDALTYFREVFVLPLDTEDRDEVLQELRNRTGGTYKTSWTPVGHFDQKLGKMNGDALNVYDRLIDENPWFSLYYEEL